MKMKEISLLNLKVVREKKAMYYTELREGTADTPNEVVAIANQVLGMNEQPYESMVAMTLDVGLKINGVFEVFRGTVDRSLVHPRDIYQRALLQNASAIVLVHNHPAGSTSPSQADIETTEMLIKAGQTLGIQVIDHIIIAHDSYTSIRQHYHELWI